MDLFKRALNNSSIDRQKEVVGKWLAGEQAASEFMIFAADRTDDLTPHGIENLPYIRKIQADLVRDMVAHGDHGIVDDPLIREFLAKRAA